MTLDVGWPSSTHSSGWTGPSSSSYEPLLSAPGEIGAAGLVRLANNESALGPSPAALLAACECLESAHRYPDARHMRLKVLLAARLECSTLELAVGNGSGELIDSVFRMLGSRGAHIVVPRLSFVAYRSCAALNGCVLTEAPIAHDLSVDVDSLLDALKADTRLVVLANPNNPTGAALDLQDLRRLAQALHARRIPLVLDYAYWEYAAGGMVPEPMAVYREFSNVIVLRTFSKAYGLAGLRVGYALAAPDVIALLERGRPPFNVSEPALAAACAALEDGAHLARTLAVNRVGREWLGPRLVALGLGVYGGPTNFVLVDVRRPAQPLHQRLFERGIAVRSMDAYGLKTCLRITVGLPAENDQLVAALQELL